MGKAQWIALVSREFSDPPPTRFLNVIARFKSSAGMKGARVLLVEDARRCHPRAFECFANYRIETITVMEGQIIALERSRDFTHRLTSDGRWDIYD
jgi:hypothetical protein